MKKLMLVLLVLFQMNTYTESWMDKVEVAIPFAACIATGFGSGVLLRSKGMVISKPSIFVPLLATTCYASFIIYRHHGKTETKHGSLASGLLLGSIAGTFGGLLVQQK